MKYGRITGKDLEEITSRIKKGLPRKASHACAFVVAPYLVSDRTQNGLRGEMRTRANKNNHPTLSFPSNPSNTPEVQR